MSDRVKSAVILSAGIGERLRPLTDFIPKPLFPIANRPALEVIIEKLQAASVTDYYFNSFHLAEQVENYLARRTDINKTVVREKILRKTGGGIANFRDSLKSESFILHNCDVYSDENLSELIEYHCNQDVFVTLMVVDFPEINTIEVEDLALKTFYSASGNRTYAGIAVLSQKVWDYFPDQESFSLIPVLSKALRGGEEIAIFDSKAYWCDFGSIRRYWELHRQLAKGESLIADKTAQITNCSFRGFNFVGEGAKLTDSELENCIVFPQAVVKLAHTKNYIFHPKIGLRLK